MSGCEVKPIVKVFPLLDYLYSVVRRCRATPRWRFCAVRARSSSFAFSASFSSSSSPRIESKRSSSKVFSVQDTFLNWLKICLFSGGRASRSTTSPSSSSSSCHSTEFWACNFLELWIITAWETELIHGEDMYMHKYDDYRSSFEINLFVLFSLLQERQRARPRHSRHLLLSRSERGVSVSQQHAVHGARLDAARARLQRFRRVS